MDDVTRALYRALELYGRHRYNCDTSMREQEQAGVAGPECICGLARAKNAPETWEAWMAARREPPA